MEENCGLPQSTGREAIGSGCTGSNSSTTNSAEERCCRVKKKRIYGIPALCAMNVALCSSLLIIASTNRSLLFVALTNLAFTTLAVVAFVVRTPQLLIACVIYKILCATYLSFLICKLIDALVMEQCNVTAENIWLIVALMCTTIEISLFRLLMNFKVEVREDRIQQSPPKYSTCALTSSATNSQLPPTYNEALKMIEEQKTEMQKRNSEMRTLPPSIYTVQIGETTRPARKDNLPI